MSELLSPREMEARLRAIGAERYHNKHPFHELMNAGKLTRGQLQAWALNHYYYQATIPIKDAAILSRMSDAGMRRIWRQRIIDHDGDSDQEGGIARWLALTDGLSLDRAYVTSLSGILPATRFAVEVYVHFVREKTLIEAIASSLTELFSPETISVRVASMLRNCDYITPDILAYLEKRLTQAPRDSDFARRDRASLAHARAERVEYCEALFRVAVFGECARERDGRVRVVGFDMQRALPLGDGESGLAAQRVQSPQVVARLRVSVVLKSERRLQSLLGLVPATEPREHDAEVVLRARVVAVTLRDGLSVSLDGRVRLAEPRQRVPRVIEEGRVEPLL